MKRSLYLAYGVACYLLFLATYAYFCLFTGNLWVPQTIDSPRVTSPGLAVAINLLLVAAFSAQHSVMARPAFKRFWTRVVPTPIERSTYVLLSCVALGLLMWQWRSIDAVVWHVEHPAGRVAVWILFAAGWLMVPTVSLMINHFDLFGLRQVWFHWRNREYEPLPFHTPMLYAHIRHPLYVGWALSFWATPTMTAGHLLLAVTLTVYMGLAVLVEERDLVAYFGPRYEDYQQRVPRYVPRMFGRRSAADERLGLAGHDPAVGAQGAE